MEEIYWSLEPPEIRISDAAVKSKCSIESLLYQAELGKLTIKVLADEWKVGGIYEIDHSIEFDKNNPITSYRGPALPLITLSGSTLPVPWQEFPKYHYIPTIEGSSVTGQIIGSAGANVLIDLYKSYRTFKNSFDKVVGNIIYYAPKTAYQYYFDRTLNEKIKIAAITFQQYRINPKKAWITLDFNSLLGDSDGIHERFIYPNPSIQLEDALNKGLLYVVTEDLQKLFPNKTLPHENTKAIEALQVEPVQVALVDEDLSPTFPIPAGAGYKDSKSENGLTIKALASAFSETGWDEVRWGKYLDIRLTWVKEARIDEGKQGGNAATFDPVMIALRLQSKLTIPDWKLNNAFRDNESLQSWADKWHESQSPYKKHSK